MSRNRIPNIQQRFYALHNRWSKIKHVKAIADPKSAAKKGKISIDITVCAREGGIDPSTNVRLRCLIENARKMNVPKKVIDNALAVAEGVGKDNLNKFVFWGYGDKGVAVHVSCLTDSVNRTAQQIRKIFDDHDGEPGDCQWYFESRGTILFDKLTGENGQTEDALIEKILESGAEDFVEESNYEGEKVIRLYCKYNELHLIKSQLEGWPMTDIDIVLYPKSTVDYVVVDEDKISDPKKKAKVNLLVKMISKLEDHDDVVKVFHNANFLDPTQ